MANNLIFNINQNPLRSSVFGAKARASAPNLPENGIVQAIIAQRDAAGTVLRLADGADLNVRQGHGLIEGEVGDTVFFEITQTESGDAALRQIFPESAEQNLIAKQFSLKNLQDLMIHKDFASPTENPLDAAALAESRAELARKTNEAVAKLTRSINRISSNSHSAAIAQLAASGINIDKISISLLDSVTSRLDAAKTANSPQMLKELSQKLESVMDLSDDQIARLLQSGAPLTLDNLYAYKHSGVAELPSQLKEADWLDLQADVARFFQREGLEETTENLERARFLLENGLPLNLDNLNRLIFLSDIEAHISPETLLDAALNLDADSKNLGGLEVYNHEELKVAEIRMMMSYEANLPLIGTDLEMDLTPQTEALKQLREKAGELINALREVQIDNPQNREVILDTFRSVLTLPFIDFNIYANIAQKTIEFTPSGLENLIISGKYDENATVASLKYGDVFAKISQHFAPLLKDLSLPADDDSIRAAKILSMNNLDINAENLLLIKDIDAKLADVQSRLHPRMAAQMIAEGLNPATMYIDEILSHMDKFDKIFETNDDDKLVRHIIEMDKTGEIEGDLRRQVLEIYQMLHKISKNEGAGIGFAVNSGIGLTLENLMDFSKNFNASAARRNILNYSVGDGVYYAKHLVTSFISAARPKPLAHFVQTESLTDPLSASVVKLESIAQNMEKHGEIESEHQLDIQRVNQSIRELAGGGENIRFLVSTGLPVTLGNIRQLKAVKERKLDKDLSILAADELEELTQSLQSTDLEAFAAGQTPAALNNNLLNHVEEARENSLDAEKITKLDILMQNLNFRSQMLSGDFAHDFSCAININGRIADAAMFVINNDINLQDGVTAYINLKTAMGEISALAQMGTDSISVRFAASEGAKVFLQENKSFLEDLMASIGAENFDMDFADSNSIKRRLSGLANLPI